MLDLVELIWLSCSGGWTRSRICKPALVDFMIELTKVIEQYGKRASGDTGCASAKCFALNGSLGFLADSMQHSWATCRLLDVDVFFTFTTFDV